MPDPRYVRGTDYRWSRERGKPSLFPLMLKRDRRSAKPDGLRCCHFVTVTKTGNLTVQCLLISHQNVNGILDGLRDSLSTCAVNLSTCEYPGPPRERTHKLEYVTKSIENECLIEVNMLEISDPYRP